MKKLCLILINVLALAPAGWCAYADKEDTNTNYIAEPVLPPGTPAAQKIRGRISLLRRRVSLLRKRAGGNAALPQHRTLLPLLADAPEL